MLAVFVDRLKSAIGRQVAILDPKTFEEAVASATRIETLDRTKSSGKLTGAPAEIKEEPKEPDPVTKLMDRFGVVLARLETMPQQNQHSVNCKNKNAQRGRGRQQQFYQNKTFQSKSGSPSQTATAGGEGKGWGSGLLARGKTNRSGYSNQTANERV